MVKGTTRQVIIVKGTKATLFDQAIFLVRDDIVAKGGVTDKALVSEAYAACKTSLRGTFLKKMLWSLSGGGVISLIWLMTVIF
ncbi:MAG: hypothetical protein J6J43_03075 [Oscillospiraceae bacterium]|nr:hypothetical protein [Oscillospiraceae bacterium]